MSTYINGGVRHVNGEPITTKKALKAAIIDNAESVYFYDTSEFGPRFSGIVSGMPNNASLQVVGPDPYRNRQWYASITCSAKGIKVT